MIVSKALAMSEDPTRVFRGRRFWLTRIGQGAALGAVIATLDFLYYAPLLPVPINVELGFFIASLVLWSGECALFAVMLGAAEHTVRPKDLHAWQLAAVALVAVTTSVVAWHGFSILVLRDQLGVSLFREQVASSGNWAGYMLYHAWLVLFFGGLCVAVGASHRWHARMLAVLRAAELRRATSQRQFAQTKLAQLEARVDPTYLFQTLARLEALYVEDPPAADALLDELITFLRSALGEYRASLHPESS